MTESDTAAQSALRGDRRVLAKLAAGLVRPERDNLVPRPWGGNRIGPFKRLSEVRQGASMPFGEAFEISAFRADAEAARFPSVLSFDDGSAVDLPTLLEAQGEALLGDRFLRRHGACFPLLPKTLSVRDLLSVQGHPPGHTEVYVIIDADPGATLRLGFRRDIDAAAMSQLLARGLERQRELLAAVGARIDAARLQASVAPWLAGLAANTDPLDSWLGGRELPGPIRDNVLRLLGELKDIYWHVLDSMNEIEVVPGQVIYNATPERLLASVGGTASAEVHALGNPEGREILALEIRRPGPTFRAWDNVRFPPREVDVGAAIAALNLSATRPEEFLREKLQIPGRARSFVSVDCEHFRVEHLLPEAGAPIEVPAAGPHSLHCLAGRVRVIDVRGETIGRLERGESALVPIGVGDYLIEADAPAELVRVVLPEDE